MIKSKPRVLLLDIETSPNLGFTWGRWEQNVIENTKDWYMLSFAYKWLDEKTVRAFSLPDFSLYKKDREDDLMLCLELHDLLDEADIVIAHNGDEFDIKKSNARLLVNEYIPPSPYKTIDTKKVAKRYFKFDSNKLDELGRQLGIGRKMKHSGFELWKGCMNGDKKSWKEMVQYNKNDIILLEKVFLKMRPWISNYPVLYPDNGTCRACGGKRLTKSKLRATKKGWKQQYQCQDCGSYASAEAEVKKVERNIL